MADHETSFLGRGWGFPPAFDNQTGSLAMVEDEEDVRQSLGILLSTRIGERLLQPGYGCELDRYLFEPVDTTFRASIGELVRSAILYFEPRIVLESVDLIPFNEEGRLDIEVRYHIPSVNSRANLVFPFYPYEGASQALWSATGMSRLIR